jgi:hypothetical protein
MQFTLSNELAQALDQQGDVPLPTVHPSSGKTFFLVSEERYERLKPLFEEDPFTQEEQRFQLQQLGKRAAWDDPAMDAYDRYDEHRTSGQS